ncbi:MAG TPA: hypothetical protein VJ739_01715 [Gemmataceae bacterium]|nr:hypothetical protein [Gemmataceae bacterium]
MNNPIRVSVDARNPGQFFACCGLLELADRLLGGVEGWFEGPQFLIRPANGNGKTLGDVIRAIAQAHCKQLDPDDEMSSPIELPPPFGMRLDWWQETDASGRANPLKVWAGSMRNVRIARAMQSALAKAELQTETLFDRAMVVYDPGAPDKKVEPFYFDSRRGANAQPLDIGFSPDPLQITTAAYPAVEFLCLVGLQRCRPRPTERPRVFDYYSWSVPLGVAVLPAAVCGFIPAVGAQGYRFENGFRTDQRKHKSFLPSTPIGGDA